jgi:hypothetical protein
MADIQSSVASADAAIRSSPLSTSRAVRAKRIVTASSKIEHVRACCQQRRLPDVYGLQKDIAAVTAAVETDWSNGQVEGQVNRLQAIKRQMYGRAGFNLLRARIRSRRCSCSLSSHQNCGRAHFYFALTCPEK